jgi:hypothetical protein
MPTTKLNAKTRIMTLRNPFLSVLLILFTAHFSLSQTTITSQVNTNSDDAEEEIATGAIDIPSTDLEFINDGGATTFCAGGSVTLSAPASTSYLWSNGATTQSINATAAGSYTVQVTNVSGCQSSASAATTVTVNALPTIAAATVVEPNACATLTGSIEVAGSGFGNLTWTGSGSGSLTNVSLPATVNTLGAGSYSFTFVDANTCTSNNLLVVLSDPTPPVTPTISLNGATIFCEGGSVTLTSSESAGNTWSTSDMSNAIVVSTSGTYLVTYTDINGCSATSAPVTVTVNPLPSTPSITAGGATTLCEGGSVTLTSSEMSNNEWSNASTSNSINVTASGTYSVTYTDGNGCEATSAGLSVTVNPLPNVTMSALADVCLDVDPFTLSNGQPSGGTYVGNGVSNDVFDPSAAGVGTHTIEYTFIDANSCSNSASETIIVNDCLGLNTLETAEYLVYPNPTTDMLHIECKCDYLNAELKVFDAIGRLIHAMEVVQDPTELNVRNWANGTYTIVIESSSSVFKTQIVKQ